MNPQDDLINCVLEPQNQILVVTESQLSSKNQLALKTKQVTQLSAKKILSQESFNKRFHNTLVFDQLEYLDKPIAYQLIAKLRDVLSEQIHILAPISDNKIGSSSGWCHADFISLGFRLIKSYCETTPALQLFRFDMYNYKRTPDWLNSKYWANPEMWDKNRW